MMAVPSFFLVDAFILTKVKKPVLFCFDNLFHLAEQEGGSKCIQISR
jgi:hypothetical protein